MADVVDPQLLLACCANYAFVALENVDVLATTYRLTWIDPQTVEECLAEGTLAAVLQAMAAACQLRVPAPVPPGP